jgi:hypothetical protein
MRLVLRNGFVHPTETFVDADHLDAMVEEAEQRSVVVQGVRCVSMVAGRLLIHFHDGCATLEAQMKTGWLNAGDAMLQPTLKPRDGVHASIVAQGHAYGDYVVEEEAA